MPGLGMQELVVILVIVAFLFGTKRIASFGRDLGEGIRGLTKGLREGEKEEEEDE